MNCKICFRNYFITEDTKSCYTGEIDNYYLDIDYIYKRCHNNCLRCYTKPINESYMNCKTCIENYFITEDTKSCYNYVLDNYYLDIMTLKRCFRNCFLCNGAPSDRHHMNCTTCKENYYMTEDTNSCYRRAIDNYYLENITLKRCHPNCLDCYTIDDNITFFNCLKCYEDFGVNEDKKTCYNYINKNFIDNFNINISIEKDFYNELQIDNNYLQFTSINNLKQNINEIKHQ